MVIVGISAFYHDSAAAIIKDGQILAAAQEERFTRKKHDSAFPEQALHYCLSSQNLTWKDVDAVVYYDKPWLKFERILETYYALAPKGAASFRAGLPVWIKEKALLPRLIRKYIPHDVPLKFSSHHMSHAASAFFPSPFESAAVLTLDGVGEWATATISHGKGKELSILKEMNFPHSVGLLYSAFTQYCGFKVNSGEYKLMGLAPYGNHGSEKVEFYKKQIKNELCHIYEDGGVWLNQDYFRYTTGLEMVNGEKWEKLFQLPQRAGESTLTQDYCDLALAIQEVTEEIVIKLAKTALKITGEKNLCLAGGVALNCVANGALLRNHVCSDLWVQPASGDAGGAVGCALAFYYSHNVKRKVDSEDSMSGSYLGPDFKAEEIKKILDNEQIVYAEIRNPDEYCSVVSDLIQHGNVVGWFQGRMEFGPRALGGRSILADPRSPDIQKTLNLKIKYRESFRPFAPSVIEEDASTLFEAGWKSPYMLLVDKVKANLNFPLPDGYASKGLMEKLYFIRSKLPSITHLDYSARVQTVHKKTNPLYHNLISSFKAKTGYGCLVNTSFNVRGEPIVGSPEDAIRCLFQTEMDTLAIGPFVIEKKNQTQDLITTWKNKPSAYALD